MDILELVKLPNEILLAIFDSLDRLTLNRLLCVNRCFYPLAQYTLKHKKKIRFCGDNSRVLVLALPSKHDQVVLDSPLVRKNIVKIRNYACEKLSVVSRSGLLVKALFGDKTVFSPIEETAQRSSNQFENGRKKRSITAIIAPNKKRNRRNMWVDAVAADLLLFLVDPDEIDEHAAEIEEMIFGACFMMAASTVIIAIDFNNHSSIASEHLRVFYETRAKVSKILNEIDLDLYYKFVPVNVRTGCHIAPDTTKYEWFTGPTLRQIILEDQLCTNFDEALYQQLCDMPLKIQIMDCQKIGGIGTVIEGRVISGMLRDTDDIIIYPTARQYPPTSWRKVRVHDMETYLNQCTIAIPGYVIGVNSRSLHVREVDWRTSRIIDGKSSEVIDTIAFRADITVMKPDRFTRHQMYTVLYGAARIRCVLLWIFPEDDTARATRKLKPPYDQVTMPQKPKKSQMDIETYKAELWKYKLEVSKVMTAHRKICATSNIRPPRSAFRKTQAILVPLDHYDIETYKDSEFEKSHIGKVMIVEKGSIVATGRVKQVINCASNLTKPFDQGYQGQFAKLADQAVQLFTLPEEQKQFELFIDHLTNNMHAKKSVLKQKLAPPKL